MQQSRIITAMLHRLAATPMLRDPQAPVVGEDGMTTAELLANAALGVGALVIVWGLMRTLGVDVLSWMRAQIGIG